MRIKQVAEAFVAGNTAKCHNARTDGKSYWLHGNELAVKTPEGVMFNWCGWHTTTTANHINEIAVALKSELRVSYASARDNNVGQFLLVTI